MPLLRGEIRIVCVCDSEEGRQHHEDSEVLSMRLAFLHDRARDRGRTRNDQVRFLMVEATVLSLDWIVDDQHWKVEVFYKRKKRFVRIYERTTKIKVGDEINVPKSLFA